MRLYLKAFRRVTNIKKYKNIPENSYTEQIYDDPFLEFSKMVIAYVGSIDLACTNKMAYKSVFWVSCDLKKTETQKY